MTERTLHLSKSIAKLVLIDTVVIAHLLLTVLGCYKALIRDMHFTELFASIQRTRNLHVEMSSLFSTV